MNGEFSGYPVTRWLDTEHRIMEILEDFYYIDSDGKQWDALAGSLINGATIPKPLWSTVGPPYVGCYRKASIVHDVAVGELNNLPVTQQQREEADSMFHDACLYEGCGLYYSGLLYLGVCLGTWFSSLSLSFLQETSGEKIARASRIRNFSELRLIRESSESKYIRMKFWEILDDPDTEKAFEQKEAKERLYLFDKIIARRTVGIDGDLTPVEAL